MQQMTSPRKYMTFLNVMMGEVSKKLFTASKSTIRGDQLRTDYLIKKKLFCHELSGIERVSYWHLATVITAISCP